MRQKTDINVLEIDREEPMPVGQRSPRLTGAGQSSRRSLLERVHILIFLEWEESEEASSALGKSEMVKLLSDQ